MLNNRKLHLSVKELKDKIESTLGYVDDSIFPIADSCSNQVDLLCYLLTFVRYFHNMMYSTSIKRTITINLESLFIIEEMLIHTSNIGGRTSSTFARNVISLPLENGNVQ